MIIRNLLIFVSISLFLGACLPDKPSDAVTAAPATATKAQGQAQKVQQPSAVQQPSTPQAVSSKVTAAESSNSATKAAAKTPPAIKIASDQTGTLPTGVVANKPVTPPSRVQQPANQRPPVKDVGPKLPSACTLLSESFVAQTVGVDVGYVGIKDGSGKSVTQRSCFFRWEHEGTPNSGVLVQVQKNPVPEEFAEWAAYYISAKKQQGDKAPDGKTTYRYKDFKGFGVDGAYSSELDRYYWRDKDDIIFMVAFNLPGDETKKLGWAKILATEVTKNFKKSS